MSEKEREDKQRYLRENILDRDYDAEEFMDFCENYKGSMDIDSWTLNQLKEIVQKFISTNSKTIQLSPFEYNNSKSGKADNIDWDKAFEQPLKQEAKEVNLNLIDLDFLESMGSPTSGAKVERKPVAAKQQKVAEKKLSSDPNAILAKLNDKSGQFISAYNAFALNTRQQEKQKSKREKSPEKQDFSPTNIKSQSKSGAPIEQVFVPISKDTVVIDEQFRTAIKCRSFANKPRLDGDYEVVVSGHEIVNPNPFVPNYVLYSITTNPLGVEVKRRLKDFQTLRNLLKKIFPTTQIPFLERYGRRLAETEPNTIRKQKLFLQNFLNGLLMNKSIRCKIIDDFLLCDKLDTLKKIFRDFQKLDRPKAIEDLYTSAGKLDIDYNSQNKKFVSQQQLYFDYLQTNFVKLKELYDQLALSLSNSVRIINEISGLYDNLRDSTRNVNNLLNQSLKSGFLESTFDKISDLHKHWALSLKTQSKVCEVEVRHLCRYEAANIDTIREVCKTTDSLVEAYSRRDNKVQAARQQYQFNKRLNQYKSGVESASKNTTVLRYQAGLWLASTVSEIRRYFSELSDKMAKKYKIFSVLQLNICNDLQNNWRQFQAFATVHAK